MIITRRNFAFILFVLSTTHIFGQETVNPNDSVNHHTYVSSLNGIEIKIDGYTHGYHTGSNMSPLLLDYIKEERIFKTASIIFRGGIVFIPVNIKDSHEGTIIRNPVIKGNLNYCIFALNFEVEPRWYWGIKERTLKGKATLNSGWFLSFPSEVTIPLDISYNTIPDGYDLSLFRDYRWFKDYLRIYFNSGPAVGYRFSPIKNCYIEGLIQILAENYRFRQFENQWSGSPSVQAQFKISGAYVFKESNH